MTAPHGSAAGAAARPLLRRAAPWLLLAAGSTMVGVYFATQAYANPEMRRLLSWRKALTINLVYYWLWGAAVPLVVALGRRWRLEGRRCWRSLLLHLLASVLLAAAIIVATESILTLALGLRLYPLPEVLTYAFEANFHSLLPTYWLILAAALAFDYQLRLRDREIASSQLEARLAEAQLRALRMQLQPHFLFNTLNSISSLMYSDLEAADSMMTRLADFLRLTLESDGAAEVTLARELEFVQRYLAIERIRFEERLRVEVTVEDAARQALVPTLVLQPLVENALRHGIDRRPEGGRVTIAARRNGDRLQLQVSNDGRPGAATTPSDDRPHVGLANTRERLAQLYGKHFALDFVEQPAGGAEVVLELPWRIFDEAADDDRRRRAAGAREAAGAPAAP